MNDPSKRQFLEDKRQESRYTEERENEPEAAEESCPAGIGATGLSGSDRHACPKARA